MFGLKKYTGLILTEHEVSHDRDELSQMFETIFVKNQKQMRWKFDNSNVTGHRGLRPAFSSKLNNYFQAVRFYTPPHFFSFLLDFATPILPLPTFG